MAKIVCLDAGHGGTDPGACGNGLKEMDITLKMVKTVGPLLSKQGITVVYTRTTDTYVALNQRCTIANNKACDCFVSIHNNAATNTTANGIETLCYTKNNLASYIQQELISSLKLTDRGVKERKDLAVLNGTYMVAVLVELGFISNKDNAALLADTAWLNKAAVCIAKGICKYLNIDYRGDAEMQVSKVKRNYKYENKIKTFEVINVDGNNYISVRDLAELLGKSVSYDNATKLTEIKG